jgi:hypothetical protein
MLDIFECVNDNALKSVVIDYFEQATDFLKKKLYEMSHKVDDFIDLTDVVYGESSITLRQLAFVCKRLGIPMLSVIGNNPDFSLENYFISGHYITRDEYNFLDVLSELSENDEDASFDKERNMFIGRHMSEVLNYLNFQSENYEFLATVEDLDKINKALSEKDAEVVDSVYTTGDEGYSYVKKYRLLTKHQQGRLLYYMDSCIENYRLAMESSEESSDE